jgi:O-antigen ligase
VLAAPPAALIRAAQLSWQRPSIIAALTICLLCVPSPSTGESDGVEINAVDVGALVLVGLVVVRRLFVGTTVSLSRPIAFGAAAVLTAYFAATLSATDLERSLTGFVRYAEVFVLVPVAVALTLERRSDLVIVLGSIVAVGVVQGAIGTFQFLTGTGAELKGETIRAVGTFGAYDIMSMATVVSFAWLVALAVALGAEGRMRRVALWGVVLLPVPLAMSLSRGAWITAIVTALVVAALSGWRRALVSIGIVGLLLVAALGAVRADLGVVGERAATVVTSSNAPDRSVQDRYDMWRAAMGMWRDHPLTGVGLKNFSLWRDSYAPLSLSSGSDISQSPTDFSRVELLSPHNLYLLVGSEQGWLGLAAFAGLILALGLASLRRVMTARIGSLELVVGLFAIAYLVRYVVDNIWSDIGGPTTVASAVLMGVVYWYASGASVSPGGETAPARDRPLRADLG